MSYSCERLVFKFLMLQRVGIVFMFEFCLFKGFKIIKIVDLSLNIDYKVRYVELLSQLRKTSTTCLERRWEMEEIHPQTRTPHPQGRRSQPTVETGYIQLLLL